MNDYKIRINDTLYGSSYLLSVEVKIPTVQTDKFKLTDWELSYFVQDKKVVVTGSIVMEPVGDRTDVFDKDVRSHFEMSQRLQKSNDVNSVLAGNYEDAMENEMDVMGMEIDPESSEDIREFLTSSKEGAKKKADAFGKMKDKKIGKEELEKAYQYESYSQSRFSSSSGGKMGGSFGGSDEL